MEFVSKETIDSYSKGLAERWQKVNTITGIRGHHFFQPVDANFLNIAITSYLHDNKTVEIFKI